MKGKWNDRYGQNEYVYGKEPNQFLKNEIEKLEKGKILFPADGEGRNSVYAAKKGWKVDAFDYSQKGKDKADKLANEMNVKIAFSLASFESFEMKPNTYDVIALIFVHMPPDTRKEFHKKCIQALKPNGVIILQAYHENQLNYNTGGPKTTKLLYTSQTLIEDFNTAKFVDIDEPIVEINEGRLHQGEASVINLVARF